MSKNTLLPSTYSTSAAQTAILCALREYEQCSNLYVANPQVKWDLHKAWRRAEEALESSRWRRRGHIAFGVDFSEYELSADTEEGTAEINAIIAGIVACQIMYPESEVHIRHILHKKGGEISIVISAKVAGTLQRMVPSMSVGGIRRQEQEGDDEEERALPQLRSPENIGLRG